MGRLLDRKFVILSAIALNLVIIAILLSLSASYFIKGNFQNLPILKDLLWELLPNLHIFWVTEIIIILSLAYLLIWSLKKDKHYLSYAISLIAIFNIIRAGLIILTPMGFPHPYEGFLAIGKLKIITTGAFPSGHLSYPFITYLITKNRGILFLTMLSGLALLISRGHYTIDLIGTLLIGFVLYKFSEKYIKKYFI